MKQPPPPPEPPFVFDANEITKALLQISNSMKALNNSRLSRKALIALIHDHSKVSKKSINIVLNNLAKLEEIWLNPHA